MDFFVYFCRKISEKADLDIKTPLSDYTETK